ncbi:MAG: hypothetical protein WD512_14265, partial [Candidatus Paceibacterota bacterium]
LSDFIFLGTMVTWEMQQYSWHPRMPFLGLEHPEFRFYRDEISPFNKIDRYSVTYYLPMRYYYSSGLNDLNGYK